VFAIKKEVICSGGVFTSCDMRHITIAAMGTIITRHAKLKYSLRFLFICDHAFPQEAAM
jgi:hypothetical protein